MIKPLLLVVGLLMSFTGISQDDGDCSQCILASEKKDTELTIEECSRFINTYKSGKSVDLAKYILAKTSMERRNFNEARSQLSSIQTSSSFFSSIINGLQGDCYLEEGNFEKATEYYKKAVLSSYNSLTPYYLHKVIVAEKKQGKKTEEQYYLRTLKKYFPQYLNRGQSSAYLLNEDGDFLKLNPKKIRQPEDLGYGTIYGKKVDIQVFDSIVKNQREKEKMMGGYPNAPIDQIWEMFTRITLIEIECNTIGLKVSNKELNSYMFGLDGYSVPEQIKQTFMDEYGNFDREYMEHKLSELKSSDSKEWEDIKEGFREGRLYEKLMFIYNKGLYLNSIELEEMSKLFTTKKNISYVLEPFSYSSDDVINTNDSELRGYFNKHQFDSEYNVYNEEREAIIVAIPNNHGENFISELLTRIQGQLAVLTGEYDKVETFSKIINESNLKGQRVSVKREEAKAPYQFTTNQGMKAIRELMFSDNAKVGDILTPPIREDNQIKIAILASIKYRNNIPFESVKETLSYNYTKTKEAEKISNHLKSVNTDDQLWNLPNVESGNAMIEQLSPVITRVGYEPNIISFAFNSLKPGVWSAPIVGMRGVYRIKVLSTEKISYPDDQINRHKEGIEREHFYTVDMALIQNAQIIDNRWFFEPTY